MRATHVVKRPASLRRLTACVEHLKLPINGRSGVRPRETRMRFLRGEARGTAELLASTEGIETRRVLARRGR
jgi:hypothetical protein